ncbi:hypothetical protein EI94DRAFT_866759 [Lactarius quietus]|nr:hypothetical protein EI94DRAFT_866759 [Lactarius quietus]
MQAPSNRNNNHAPVSPSVSSRTKGVHRHPCTPTTSPRRKQRACLGESIASVESEQDDSDDNAEIIVDAPWRVPKAKPWSQPNHKTHCCRWQNHASTPTSTPASIYVRKSRLSPLPYRTAILAKPFPRRSPAHDPSSATRMEIAIPPRALSHLQASRIPYDTIPNKKIQQMQPVRGQPARTISLPLFLLLPNLPPSCAASLGPYPSLQYAGLDLYLGLDVSMDHVDGSAVAVPDAETRG